MKLRERATELGISISEAARRVGLTERRFANYVNGTREPDLTTLVRIAEMLNTTPNVLLGFGGSSERLKTDRDVLRERLGSASAAMDHSALELTVVQAEAVARLISERSRDEGSARR